jgi:DNA-binding transcriptional LysR family regulator
LDLRADKTVLSKRLDQLRAVLPRSHPIHSYNRETAGYSQASCINWERNSFTRASRHWLAQEATDAVHAIPRPLMAEEPKLLVGGMALFMAALAAAASGFIGWLIRRRSQMSGRHPSSGTGTIPNGVAMGTCPCGR